MELTTQPAIKALSDAQAKITKMQEKVDALLPDLEVAGRLIEAFPAMNLSVSLGFETGVLQGVSIIVSDLTDMRDVAPLQRWLVTNGYHIKRHHDWPEIRRRTYDYGPIQLSAFLKYGTGAKCAWVPVGKKEETVYELRCEDGTIVDPEQPAEVSA